MPTEEELEQRVNDHIDSERIKDAVLKLEIETLRKGLDKVENVSGICDCTRAKQGD